MQMTIFTSNTSERPAFATPQITSKTRVRPLHASATCMKTPQVVDEMHISTKQQGSSEFDLRRFYRSLGTAYDKDPCIRYTLLTCYSCDATKRSNANFCGSQDSNPLSIGCLKHTTTNLHEKATWSHMKRFEANQSVVKNG